MNARLLKVYDLPNNFMKIFKFLSNSACAYFFVNLIFRKVYGTIYEEIYVNV